MARANNLDVLDACDENGALSRVRFDSVISIIANRSNLLRKKLSSSCALCLMVISIRSKHLDYRSVNCGWAVSIRCLDHFLSTNWHL